MKTIWKFEIELRDDVVVAVPRGAEILSVQSQGGVVRAWYLVDPAQPKVVHHLKIKGAGQDCDDLDGYSHLDTVQQGAYAWHVFKRVGE